MTGKAGGGWEFMNLSTAVGPLSRTTVRDRVRLWGCGFDGDRYAIPGGTGDARGASNQGLAGSISGEFAFVTALSRF